jgi:glycosyltransferase involved in cell wall biosynthesis
MTYSHKSVCIITSYAPSIIRFRSPLIISLVSSGYSVSVVAPDFCPKIRAEVTSLGASPLDFPLSRASISPFLDIVSFFSLFHILRSIRPHVILTYFVKPNIWGILSAACVRVPRRVAMVEGMGYAFTESTRFGRSFKQRLIGWFVLRLYSLSLALAHRIIVLNSDDFNFLSSSCGLSVEKIVILSGIGVDLDEWRHVPAFRSPFTFTMVARLLREKGVFDFLEAAQYVKSKYPQVRFLLLGAFDSNPGAIQPSDISFWTDENIVEFLGHVDVHYWLARTSVFVLPSYREGLPRSTQEAMALGRPIITTDVVGCRETVIHGTNGFLVPSRNSWQLALAIERFINDPNLIDTMGQASRRMAEERFDVHVANAKLREAMEV